MKFCGYCGNQIDDSAIFCEYCGKEQPLTMETAVTLAKAGDNRGFEYLYNETYKDKKFIALKYVKNEDDAEDVLQDSYIKMMSSIQTLDDPKKFSSWFGMIVANKAKDLLRKQNRNDAEGNSRRDIHFSELESEDSDGDVLEYDFEDENIEWQPEAAYTQKETQDLVREMMSTLSDEQRMALMMFHIEGMSIKEIAEVMEVNENTVKSRLNYARKNIKSQGEELQKKGYKLYGIAPLPLLLYLIRFEAKLFGANGVAGTTVAVSSGAAMGGMSAAGMSQLSGGAPMSTDGAPMSAGGAMHAPGQPVQMGAGQPGPGQPVQMGAGQTVQPGIGQPGPGQPMQPGMMPGAGPAGPVNPTAAVAAKSGVPLFAKIFIGIAAATLLAFGIRAIIKINQNRNTPVEEASVDDGGEDDNETAVAVTASDAEASSEATTVASSETTTEMTTEETIDAREILETELKSLVDDKGYYEDGDDDVVEENDSYYYKTRTPGILSVMFDDYTGDGEVDMLVFSVNDITCIEAALYTVNDGEAELIEEKELEYYEAAYDQDKNLKGVEAKRLKTDDFYFEFDYGIDNYSADIVKAEDATYLRVYENGMPSSFSFYKLSEDGITPAKVLYKGGGHQFGDFKLVVYDLIEDEVMYTADDQIWLDKQSNGEQWDSDDYSGYHEEKIEEAYETIGINDVQNDGRALNYRYSTIPEETEIFLVGFYYEQGSDGNFNHYSRVVDKTRDRNDGLEWWRED